jgi:hypothetical protein
MARSQYSGPLEGPVQLKTNIEIKHQFRYVSSSGNTKAITDTLLMTAAGVSAQTAVIGNSIYQSVRVNRIEIWSPPSSQGSAVTCSVLFPSTGTVAQSMAREITDTTVSVAKPAHIVCSPPKESLCAFWQSGSYGQTLFSLTAPAGSIIDLWLSLVLADGAVATPAQTATLVGATVGNMYYCSLDSSTSAGSVYKPVGLSTL